MTPKAVTLSPLAAEGSAIVRDLRAFLTRYVTFPATDDYSLTLALWVVMTYLFPSFDAVPYLVITADTKRAGKSRCMEVLSFLTSNPRNIAAVTPATIFRSIRDEQPTLFIDEAESLSGEAAGDLRTVLNIGYRKGQTVPRVFNNEVVEFPVFCPKCFVLIGDVFDTLRDRAIIVRMVRGEPRERFRFEYARLDADELRDRIRAWLDNGGKKLIQDAYNDMSIDGLTFLGDRDEEIWLPLFAVASAMHAASADEIARVAVDFATEKTMPKRRYVSLAGAEQDAADEEYRVRLLRDLRTVMDGRKHLHTADALEALHALPTGPWRKFRGDGLDAHDMANLLSSFGVKPKLIKERGRPLRGYTRIAVDTACKTHGI